MLSAALGVLIEETESGLESVTIIELAAAPAEAETSSINGSAGNTHAAEDLYAGLDDGGMDDSLLALPNFEAEPVGLMPTQANVTGSPAAFSGGDALSDLPLKAAGLLVVPPANAGSAVEEMFAAGLGLAAPPPVAGQTIDTTIESSEAVQFSNFLSSLTIIPISETLISWMGGNGLWSDASKWSTGVVPTATDHVLIDANGSFTVTISSNFSASSLTLGGANSTPTLSIATGAALTLSGDLQVREGATLSLLGNSLSSATGRIDGTFNWAGGTLLGSGALTIGSGGRLNLAINTTTKTLSRTLVNDGAMVWSSQGWVLRNGTFINNGTATFTVSATLAGFSAGEAGSFVNNGTLIYAPGSVLSTLGFGNNLAFTSTGIVRVDQGSLVHIAPYAYTGGQIEITGTLRLNVSGFRALTLERIFGPGTLDIRAGSITINAPLDLGSLFVTPGTGLAVNGAVNISTAATINGGSFDLFGAATFAQLDLTGTASVTANGSASLVVTGILRFNSGNSTLAGSTLQLGASSQLLITSGGTRSLLFNTVNVSGTATLGNTTILASAGAAWTFTAGSSVAIFSTLTLQLFGGSGTAMTLLNQGALTVTGSNSTTVRFIGVAFTNAGSVFVNGGVFDIQRAFVQTAGLFELAGGRVNATTGVFSLLGGELRGTGIFTGTVINSATVRPGRVNGTLGELEISFGYTQTATGRLVLEALGLEPPFDNILANTFRSNGPSVLDGVFELVRLSGFAARTGDTFLIYKSFFQTPSGGFSQVVGLDPTGYTFELARTSSGYELRTLVAPVPSIRAWDGGGDGVSFLDPLNWAEDILPSRRDAALIAPVANASVTLGSDARVGALILGGGAGAVTFNVGVRRLLTLPDDGDDTTTEGVTVRPGATLVVEGGQIAGRLINEGVVVSRGGRFDAVNNFARFEIRPGSRGTVWGGFNHQQRGDLIIGREVGATGFLGFTVVSSFTNSGLLRVEANSFTSFSFRTGFGMALSFTNATEGTVELLSSVTGNFISSVRNDGTWRQVDANFTHNANSGMFFNRGRIDLAGTSVLNVFSGIFVTILANDGDLYVGPDASLSVSGANASLSLGSGRVQIDGTAGATNIRISNAFVGGTGILQGTLTNTGGVVAPGAKPLVGSLGGGGAIGGSTGSGGAALERGAGLLTVNGAYIQQAQGRFEVRIFDDLLTGLATIDRLAATSITLNGQLAVIGRSGAVPIGSGLTILQSSSPISGAFSSIIERSGFDLGTGLAVAVVANAVTLTLTPASAGLVIWLGGDGLWTDSAKWSTGTVPTAGAAVAIGAGTVTLPAGFELTLSKLELGGGALAGQGTLRISDAFLWWAGALEGTVTLAVGTAETVIAGQTQVDFGRLVLRDTARLEVGRDEPFGQALTFTSDRGRPTLAFVGDAPLRVAGKLLFDVTGDGFVLENRSTLEWVNSLLGDKITLVNFGALNLRSTASLLRIEQRSGSWGNNNFDELTVIEGVFVSGGVFSLPSPLNGDVVVSSGGILLAESDVTINGTLEVQAGGVLVSKIYPSEGTRAGQITVNSATLGGELRLRLDSFFAGWREFLRSNFTVLRAANLTGNFASAAVDPADATVRISITRTPISTDDFEVKVVTIDAEPAFTSWLGGDGNWNDPTRWSGGVVPSYADDVTINGGIITLANNITEVGVLHASDATFAGQFSSLRVYQGGEFENVVLTSVSLSLDQPSINQSFTIRGSLGLNNGASINNGGELILDGVTATTDGLASISGGGVFSLTGASVDFGPSITLAPFGPTPLVVDTSLVRINSLRGSFSGGIQFDRDVRVEGSITLDGPLFIPAGVDVQVTGGFFGGSTVQLQFGVATIGGELIAGSLSIGGSMNFSGSVKVFAEGELVFTGVRTLQLVTFAEGEISFVGIDLLGVSPVFSSLVVNSRAVIFTATGIASGGDPDVAALIATLNAGLSNLASQVSSWASLFGFAQGSFTFLPDRLDTFFNLTGRSYFNPTAFSTGLADYAALADSLTAAGYSINFIAGALPNFTAALGSDQLQASFTTTINVDVDGGLTELNFSSGEFLAGLTSNVSALSGTFQGNAAVVLTLVFGVDANGFYITGPTGLALAASVSATDFAGSVGIGGVAAVNVVGDLSSTAELQLNLSSPAVRHRSPAFATPATLLIASGVIDADASAAFAIGYANFEYGIGIATTVSGASVSSTVSATLVGSLVLPGLTADGLPAVLGLTGVRSGSGWLLSAAPAQGTLLRLDGFRVSSFTVTLNLSFTVFAGAATGRLVVDGNTDLGTLSLDLSLNFGPTSFSAAGSATLASFAAGPAATPLVWFEAPVLTFGFNAVGNVVTAASLDFTAARGVLFPAPATLASPPPTGPLTASNLSGNISANGRLRITAAAVIGNFGAGLQLLAEGQGGVPAFALDLDPSVVAIDAIFATLAGLRISGPAALALGAISVLSLDVRRNGFRLRAQAAAESDKRLSLGSPVIFEAAGLSLGVDLTYTAGAAGPLAGGFRVVAASGLFFPGASADAFTGTFDYLVLEFALASGDVVATANRLEFRLGPAVRFVASNVEFTLPATGPPAGSIIATARNVHVDFPAFNGFPSGRIAEVVIRTNQISALGLSIGRNGNAPTAAAFAAELALSPAFAAAATTEENPRFASGARVPVLLLPGIAGSLPKQSIDNFNWMLERGLRPEDWVIDPLIKSYDDLIKSLKNAGYVEGLDLFVATYDWRLVPGPTDGVIDGIITLPDGTELNAATITDGVIEYGLDYLGYWMRKAQRAWDPAFGPLAEVDIITHSTGGLVARTYIQSAAYRGTYVDPEGGVTRQLPGVRNLFLIGVPNRGASKPWNPLHDNFAISPDFQVVLSKIIYGAYLKVLNGAEVRGPQVINLSTIASGTGGSLEENFIRQYLPTINSLLATYPFFRDQSGALLAQPPDSALVNRFVQDLNGGLDSAEVFTPVPNAFADRLSRPVQVIYGVDQLTPIDVRERVGETPLQALSPFGEIAEIADFIARNPGETERWFEDLRFPHSGDGTVPTISAAGQFFGDSRFILHAFEQGTTTTGKTGHTELTGNADVIRLILQTLLAPTGPGIISQGLAGEDSDRILGVIFDPVQGILADSAGRRLGLVPDGTGGFTLVNEIPGSFYTGGLDGVGWIVAPVELDYDLSLTGVSGDYFAQLFGTGGGLFGGENFSGTLSAGELFTDAFSFLQRFLSESLAGIVEFENLLITGNLTVNFGDTDAATTLEGELTVTADSAAIFPDTSTEAVDGVGLATDLRGTINITTGALDLAAATFRLAVGDNFIATATGPNVATEPGIRFVWDPANLDPAATLLTVRNLAVQLPGLLNPATPLPVLDLLTIRRNGFDLAASFTLGAAASLSLGNPALLNLAAPSFTLDLSLTFAGGEVTSLDANLGLAAASATFIGNDSISVRLVDDNATDALPGVVANVDLTTGSFTLTARQAILSLGGFIDATIRGSEQVIAGVPTFVPALTLGYDATAPPATELLRFGTIDATLTPLARQGLAPLVSLVGLRVNHGGDWALDSATVTLPVGYAGVFNLGLIPFRLDSLSLAFPTAGDFSLPLITVNGAFALGDLDLGFDPVIYLGDPSLIGSGLPGITEFRLGSITPISFDLDLGRLGLGEFAPSNLGPLTLGIEGLSVSGYTFNGRLSFGPFVNGILGRLPSLEFDAVGFLELISGPDAPIGARLDLLGNFTIPALGGLDLSLNATLDLGADFGGGQLALDLAFAYRGDLPAAPFFALGFSLSLERLTLTNIVIEVPGLLRLTVPRITLVIDPLPGEALAIGFDVTLEFLAFPDFGPLTLATIELFRSGDDFDGFIIRDLILAFNADLAAADGPVLVRFVSPRLLIPLLDFRDGVLAGGIGFDAIAMLLLPEAAPAVFTGRAEGIDPLSRGVTGSLNLDTNALAFEAQRFSATFGSALAITGAGFRLDFDPAITDPDALLATVASATATSPDFPELGAGTVNGLFFTRTQAGFDSLTYAAGSVMLDGLIAVDDLSVSFADVVYTYASGALLGTATLTATSATLFPGSAGLTATLNGLSGSYDLALGLDSLVITAGQLEARVAGDRLRLSASNIVLNFSGTTVATLANVSATLPDFPRLGAANITELVITRDGFTATAAIFGPAQLDRGPLRFADLVVTLSAIAYDRAAGFSAGSLGLAASSAVLFPASTAVTATLGQLAATLALSAPADAPFTFTAATLLLSVGRALRVDATGLTITLGEGGAFTLALANATASSPLIEGVSTALSGLTITEQGFTLASLILEAPTATVLGLLALVDLRLTLANLVFRPGQPLLGTVGFSAASAVLLPALGGIAPRLLDDDAADALPGVVGNLDLATNALNVTARRVELTLGGLLEVVVLPVGAAPALTFVDDPAAPADSTLFQLTTAIAKIPALEIGGVTPFLTFTNFGLRRDGRYFQGGATVTIPDAYPDVLGLGGVLPLRITEIAITFPDPDNLDAFTFSVTGRFDLDALNLPFDPILYIGDPDLIGTASPDLITILPGSPASFTFSLDVVSLADGLIAPIEFGPATLGFANLDAGGATVSGLIILGRFNASGQLEPLPGATANVTGFLRIDAATDPAFTVGARVDLAGSINRLASGSTRLSMTGVLAVAGSGTGAEGGAEITFELNLTVSPAPLSATFSAQFVSIALTNLEIDLGFVIIRADRVVAFLNPGVNDPRFILSEISVTFTAYETLTATAAGTIALFNDRIEIDGLALDLVGSLFPDATFVNVIDLGASIDATISFSVSGGVYSDFALINGGVSFTVGELELFPGSTTFNASAQNLFGSLDAQTGELTLTATGLQASFADVLSLSLLNAQLYLGNAPNRSVLQVASIIAIVSDLNDLSFTLTNLSLSRSGEFSLDSARLTNPGGILASFGLGGLLPFDITDVTLGFPTPGRLAGFTLSVAGAFDFSAFSGLPFTPVIRVGSIASTAVAPSTFTFTLALGELAAGRIAPLDLGPIQLGFENLAIGGVTLGGTIILGGFSAGVFIPAIGGSITLGAEFGDLSGGVGITLFGTYDEATSRIAVSASFSISFTLAGKIKVTDAALEFDFTLRLGADGRIALETLELTGANIARVEVRFGDFFTFTATGIALDFNPAPNGFFATIDSLTVAFPGLAGLSGTAGNFGIRADFSFASLPGFFVSLTPPGPALFGFPDWFPVTLEQVTLRFADIAVDPLDVSITFSASIASADFPLPISGRVENLTIDIGLLLAGKFPVTNLGAFLISFGPIGFGGLGLSGTLALGLAPLDAAGNLLTGLDASNDALIAQRVLFGFIEGSVAVPGIGGLTIRLGLSEVGPLVIFVSAELPILLEPTSGLSLLGLRGGVRFGAVFPNINDPATGLPDPERLRDPAFSPSGDLTADQWLDALRQQISVIVRNAGGSVGQVDFATALTSPMLLELGATLGSALLPGLSAAVDILISTEGALLMSGKLEYFLAGVMAAPFVLGQAKFFIDLREIPSGSVDIAFLLDVPGDPAVLSITGFLSFDLVRDPADSTKVIGFTLVIGGKVEVPLIAFELVGLVRLTVTTERTELFVDATLQFPILGPLNAQGLLVIDYAGEDVEIWGALSVSIANSADLGPLGIEFDAGLTIRFNVSDRDQEVVFTFPNTGEVIDVDIPANSFALFANGFLYVKNGNDTLFAFDGVFIIEIAQDTGLTIFVEASLIIGAAGPNAPPPLLSFTALGFLSLSTSGLAGKIEVILETNFPRALQLELGGSFLLVFNTTGEVVSYTPPAIPGSGQQPSSVTIPDRLTPASSPRAYALIEAQGFVALAGLRLVGQFSFAISADVLQVTAEASLDIAIGGARLLTLSVAGGFRIDASGAVAVLDLSLSAGSNSGNYAFGGSLTFRLEVNTTGARVDRIGPLSVNLEAGRYARVIITGELTILGLTLSGTFGIEVGSNGFAIAAQASLLLRVSGATLFEFSVLGALQFGPQGFAAKFAIAIGSQASGATGGSFTAVFSLEINTSLSAIPRIAGVVVNLAAGPYARVTALGTLAVGGLTLEGSFVFTVRPAFIELDANISLRLQTGAENTRTEIASFTGRALLRISPAGFVGLLQLTVSAQASVAGLGFRIGGIFQLELNTTAAAVTFANARPVFNADGLVLAGQFTTLTLAARSTRIYLAGSFVTVVGGADVLTLRGSFEFSAGAGLIAVRVFAVVKVGPLDALRLDGAFNILSSGVAGSLALTLPGGAAAADGTGYAFSGSFLLEINTTANAVTLANARQRLSTATGQVVPGLFDSVTVAARSFAVVVTGRLALSVSGSGFDLSGRFEIRLSAAELAVSAVAVLDLRVSGTRIFSFNASGALAISSAGVAARLALALQAGGGPASSLGFSVSASFVFEVNTTGAARATIAGVSVGLPAGPYLRVAMTGDLLVGGFTLSGSFDFTASAALVSITAELSFELRVGTQRVFAFSGAGALQITSRGIAGFLNVSFGGGPSSALDFSVSGADLASLRINTTGQAIELIGTRLVNLAGGPAFAEVSFTATFTVLGAEFVGTFAARVATDGVQIAAAATLDLRVDDVRIVRLRVEGAFLVNSSGIAAKIVASVTADTASALGFTFAATFTLELNTTGSAINHIAGQSVNLAAGPYLRIAAAGSLTILGDYTIEGAFVIRITTTRIDLDVSGTIDVGPFANLSVIGAVRISGAGIVVVLDLQAGARVARSATGFSFDARFRLEINTTANSANIVRIRVNETTGAIMNGTSNIAISARTVRVFVAGSLKVNGNSNLFQIHGSFTLTVASNRLQIEFNAGFNLFGQTLRVEGSGGIYFGSNPGVSLRLTLKLGSDNTPSLSVLGRFSLTGTFRLELNTRSVISDNVARQTARVAVTGARLSAAGFTLSGSLFVGVSGGVFSVTVPSSDPLTVSLWDVGTVSFSGSFRSDGFLSLTGSIGVRVGNNDLGIRGTLTASFTISGTSVSFSARVSVTVTTYLGNRDLGTFTVNSSGVVRFSVFGFGIKVNFSNFSISWDGPVAGATIVFDANRNGRADLGEPLALTNDLGEFAFEADLLAFDTNGNGFIDADEGDLLSIGGIDITTGLPVFGVTRASASGVGSFLALSISPLTNLVVAVRELGFNPTQAIDLVRTRFLLAKAGELPFDLNLIFPLDGALLGESDSLALLQRTALLPNTAAPLAALLDASSATLDRDAATNLAYRAIALTLLDGPVLDLTDAADLGAILATAAEIGGVTLDPVLAAAVVAATANANAGLLALDPRLGGPGLVAAVIRHQIVSQGEIAAAATSGDLARLNGLATKDGLAAGLAGAKPPALDYEALPRATSPDLASLAGADGRIRFVVTDDQPLASPGQPGVALATLRADQIASGYGVQAVIEAITIAIAPGATAPARVELRTSADGFGRVVAILELSPTTAGDALTATYRLPIALAVPAGGLGIRVSAIGGGELGLRSVTGDGFLLGDFSGRYATYLAGRSGTFADFLAKEREAFFVKRTGLVRTALMAGDVNVSDRDSAASDSTAALAAEILGRSSSPKDRLNVAYAALYAGL